MDETKRILAQKVPDCEVRVFGSRVKGNARKFSKLNPAIVGSEKINWRKIESLKDAFSSSDIPIIVDVIDWNAMSGEFRTIVENKYEIIQENGRPG